MTADKMETALYWQQRAQETWELAERYAEEARMFERFAEDALREADMP